MLFDIIISDPDNFHKIYIITGHSFCIKLVSGTKIKKRFLLIYGVKIKRIFLSIKRKAFQKYYLYKILDTKIPFEINIFLFVLHFLLL